MPRALNEREKRAQALFVLSLGGSELALRGLDGRGGEAERFTLSAKLGGTGDVANLGTLCELRRGEA